MKKMKKRYWRDALWFGLGTFLGGFVLSLLGGITSAVSRKAG